MYLSFIFGIVIITYFGHEEFGSVICTVSPQVVTAPFPHEQAMYYFGNSKLTNTIFVQFKLLAKL